MAIQVRNADEFERLLRALALELVDANTSFRMHVDLIAAYEKHYTTEMRQSWTFWSLTIQAFVESAIFRLCRVYDQDDNNLGLRGLLDTIRSNKHMFTKERFAKRLEGRPATDELIAGAPDWIDVAQLESDLRYVSRDTNPTVNRLIDIRHNYYAHRNAQDVVQDIAVSEAHPHMRDEVGELLRGGMDIVNRYSSLFRAEMWSTRIIGQDDYDYVLRTVKGMLAQQRDEMRRQRARYGIPDSDDAER